MSVHFYRVQCRKIYIAGRTNNRGRFSVHLSRIILSRTSMPTFSQTHSIHSIQRSPSLSDRIVENAALTWTEKVGNKSRAARTPSQSYEESESYDYPFPHTEESQWRHFRGMNPGRNRSFDPQLDSLAVQWHLCDCIEDAVSAQLPIPS